MEKEETRKKKIQKVTQKVLVIFIVTMIVLTLISKVANSITVPTVTVERISNGRISYEIEGQGELVAKDSQKIDIPDGLLVNKVLAKNGKQIVEGDSLVEYDVNSIEDAIATQYEQLLIAQQDYQQREMEYKDTLEKTELTQAQKIAKEAQEDLDKAEKDLVKAQERYDEKLSKLTSQLEENQREDYENVTENMDKASAAYEEAKIQYDKKVAKAEEVLNETETNQGNEVRDAQREYDSAKLAYEDYCRDYNRVNEAFLALVDGVLEEGIDSDSSLEKTLLVEYFGYDNYEMFYNNTISDINAYEQMLPEYNKIATAILNYKIAVAAKYNASTKEVADLEDIEIKILREKLYDLVVKPFEVDPVVSHDMELRVTVAKETLDKLNADIEKVLSDAKDVYDETIAKLDKELATTKENYEDAKEAYDEIMKKVYEDSDGEENLLIALENAIDKRDIAQKNLDTATQALTKEEILSMNKNSLLSLSENSLNASLNEITAIEDNILKLQELKDQGGIQIASINGTITELTLSNYAMTTSQDRIVVASEECYFYGTFLKDNMEYVELGDEVQLGLSGDKRPITIEVTNVYMDTMDNTIAHLEAKLPTGDYVVGTTGNFFYDKSGDRSENCINITAIREDGNDYYVLIPQEGKSILGNITKAYRVNVKIKNKDSKIAIIEGAISQGDYVITGSSKIIMSGDVVRISE